MAVGSWPDEAEPEALSEHPKSRGRGCENKGSLHVVRVVIRSMDDMTAGRSVSRGSTGRKGVDNTWLSWWKRAAVCFTVNYLMGDSREKRLAESQGQRRARSFCSRASQWHCKRLSWAFLNKASQGFPRLPKASLNKASSNTFIPLAGSPIRHDYSRTSARVGGLPWTVGRSKTAIHNSPH